MLRQRSDEPTERKLANDGRTKELLAMVRWSDQRCSDQRVACNGPKAQMVQDGPCITAVTGVTHAPGMLVMTFRQKARTLVTDA